MTTETVRPQFAFRLLPSLGDIAFLMPIAFLFGRLGGLLRLLEDGDTGWHIRTGQWILAHRAVPFEDIFSYSKAGSPWYAWEWLSDVFFAWLYGWGNLAAVALFAMLLLAATFALLYRLTRRRANVLVSVFVTMSATAASSIHWLARPHLFTLLFLTLFYAALENVRAGKRRLWGVPYLVWLPVATVLWTNLHGGFFVGIVLIGAYGAGELIASALTADRAERLSAWRRAGWYFASAGAALAASLVNPYTYHLHVHMIQYLRDPFQNDTIDEFRSVSFHSSWALFYEGLLALSVVATIWSASKKRYAEGVVMVAFAHGALLAARNIPLFVVVAAPPVAAVVEAAVRRVPALAVAGWLRRLAERFNRLADDTGETERIPRWHLASVLGVGIVAALLWAPNPPPRFRAEFDPQRFPAKAVERLGHYRSARIFTHDQWGDYLIYRLYPSQKVFLDARSDFYGSDFLKKALDVLNVAVGWDRTLARFGVDTILLPPATPLAGALKESAHWRVDYDDGVAIIFRPAASGRSEQVSAADDRGGTGRGREATKTKASDRSIHRQQPKT
jgi:hypothetical protein